MLTRAHHQRIIRACIYLPTLSAQLEISESLEANMEAEAGLTLCVLAVVAKTPSVFGTHMGSAIVECRRKRNESQCCCVGMIYSFVGGWQVGGYKCG